ncbi:hypothetical protein BH18PSE1_BH18PSE1_02750 [soil metagenome]
MRSSEENSVELKLTVKALVLIAVNDMIFRVLSDTGQHVGNLKKIRDVWKFKAIGYDRNGLVIPGGGPLTERHNTVFDNPDPSLLTSRLLG